MEVKYWFRFQGEKLFGATYVFYSEEVAKALEQQLQLHLGAQVERVLSFESKVIHYQPEHVLDWLQKIPAFSQAYHKLKDALPPVQVPEREAWHASAPALRFNHQSLSSQGGSTRSEPAEVFTLWRQSHEAGRALLEILHTKSQASAKPTSAGLDKSEPSQPIPPTPVPKRTVFNQTPEDGLADDRRRQHIQQIVHDRGIQQLVHFTRLDNVPSILQDGLISRQALDEIPQKKYFINDTDRLEGHKDAVCLSISFPNYRMFFYCRKKEENRGAGWAVLCLDPALLWELNCGFTPKNAASRDMWDHDRQSIQQSEQLQKMFGDRALHQQNGLPLNFTEDPQAEVLVFDPIPPSYITEIHFQRFSSLAPYRTGDGRLLQPVLNSLLFSSRDFYINHLRGKGML